ncbi:uncharacterized protein LOC110252576 [Exaiptasia diaphana]|uniref:SEFIR domain-containing protein n=1 Tax=Exaiptasia diaphana TaxID=2652724 RepID=A0A913Y4N3_EXADI|nr:uncharacterized protein LOC110252576 [Exaiptasia diaphana]KXJ22397.1 hypothetical protein AC249_AIPGENE27418 [Exaiptasia diaphana]
MELSRRSLTTVLIALSSIILHENYGKKVSRALIKERSTISSQLQNSNEQLSALDPCGRPIHPKNESDCKSKTFSKEQYPNCHSFAGKPSRVIVKQIFKHGRQPGIIVEFNPPSTGFKDLWAFRVRLIDLTLNHPNVNTQCKQINSKMRDKFVVHFENLGYGDHYNLRVQSMPPDGDKSTVSHDIFIQEQCDILQFQKTKHCCLFSSVSSNKKDYKINENKAVVTINITWQLTCESIQQFKLKWNTDDSDCNGSAEVKGKHFYSLKLLERCVKNHNYTGEIYGVISDQEKTNTEQFWFTVTMKSPSSTCQAPTSGQQTSLKHMEMIAAFSSVGAVLGIILLVMLLKFYKFRARPIIRINERRQPMSEARDDKSLSDPVKVLIIYASCCMPCKKVIYSLWDALDSTCLFDIRLDMLNEPQLNENPLRWYETQIKEAEKILVMTSHEMLMSDLNLGSNQNNLSDYVNIQFQLNLLRGEVSNTTDISKFVPVYNTYNGNRHDIPRFLSMCRAYKLPTELDKIMFHLLRINSIRIHSRTPIVQISSENHPFLTKKDELIKAIDDAASFHQHISCTQLSEFV